MTIGERIGHWLDDDSNRYAAITVSAVLLCALVGTVSFLAGEREAREAISAQLEEAADRNYRAIERVDCKLYEILEKIDPEGERNPPARCKGK